MYLLCMMKVDLQIDNLNPIHPKRVQAGYFYCMDCGERKAKAARASWCIAPLNKSNYILITDLQHLKQLNPKRLGE